MSEIKKILDSFSIKETLNPKVWKSPADPKKSTMIPKVRQALIRIAEEFIDDLGDDVFVEDVYLMGSLANFNWSEYSDFDLHVIVDFERYGKQEELYKELFDLKKKLFNAKHNIKIFGYDVELYAQGVTDEHHSDGVFSVMSNEWVNVPNKSTLKLNMKALKDKIKCWTDKIDDAIEDAKSTGNVEVLKKIKEKIKEYRQSGLEKDGEFSYENLVFKYLRRSGHIGKLFDEKTKIKDKELSIENKLKETIRRAISIFEQNDIQDIDNLSGEKEIDITDAISNSKFLQKLDDMIGKNVKLEFVPGQKIPLSSDVEEIQKALQLLGHSLPKWGVDGKFGPETEEATKDFQQKNNLTPTGVFKEEEIKKLIENLVSQNFQDSDLSKIKTEREFSSENFKSSLEFKDAVEIITKEIEGGYYHPKMKIENPSKFGIMGDSGETMFGMDRKHGRQESVSSAGVEFWNIIDSKDAKNNWEYGYMLEDNPELKDELLELVAEIMEPQFLDLVDRYLSQQAKEIVMSDPKLYFNFVYATYNGAGWFQKFAKKFNQKVEDGITDVEQLQNYALQIRKESGNSLIARSGKKIDNIFDAMA